MKSILITGANRGIGLGIVNYLASSSELKPDYIFAGYRKPEESKELLELGQSKKNVIPVRLDITNDESIKDAKFEVEGKLSGKGLNMLINNAGVAKKLNINTINENDMLETYRNNVIGPWKVTK
ncbi:unnamed protein product, partial [Didymodactylos carnosus]